MLMYVVKVKNVDKDSRSHHRIAWTSCIKSSKSKFSEDTTIDLDDAKVWLDEMPFDENHHSQARIVAWGRFHAEGHGWRFSNARFYCDGDDCLINNTEETGAD